MVRWILCCLSAGWRNRGQGIAVFAAVLVAVGGALAGVWAGELLPARLVWEYEDPQGDDTGPGTYLYPTHAEFTPGAFDLLQVRIWEWTDFWVFDATLMEPDNPRSAPEGFTHQLVDIYLTEENADAEALTLLPEPNVYLRGGWTYRILLAPWGGSRAFRGDGSNLGAVDTQLLPDGSTIRGLVPRAWMPGLTPRLGVTALVGGYDPWAEESYREVKSLPGTWWFGGGDPDRAPRAIDLLGPAKGRYPQSVQLGVGGRAELAVVRPVYRHGRAGFSHLYFWVTGIVFAVLFAVVTAARLVRRNRG